MDASQPQSMALALARGRNVDVADVIALLREVYADGIPTRVEAEELIAFDHSLAAPGQEWSEFFSAALADHVAASNCEDETASWLIAALSHGRRATERGFAAVLRILEMAAKPAPPLAAYAIQMMTTALIAGEGAPIGLRAHFSRMIDGDGVALLARVLTAAGGSSSQPVTRAEADALFDLHDAVAGGINDPAFGELFFRAIAQHVIAASGHATLPRGEMFAGVTRTTYESAQEFSLPPGCVAEKPGPDLTAWLATRIMRDGRPTMAEYALLRLFSCTPDGDKFGRRPFLDHAA
jgi:hypothetical protein